MIKRDCYRHPLAVRDEWYCSPTVLPSSSTSSTVRCRYSTLKLSIRGRRSMMCREEGALGQNVEAKEDNGEGDEDKEDCEGTAPSATTSATSDVL